jgi:hypothetical protein
MHQNDDYPDAVAVFNDYYNMLPGDLLPRHARLAVAVPVTG